MLLRGTLILKLAMVRHKILLRNREKADESGIWADRITNCNSLDRCPAWDGVVAKKIGDALYKLIKKTDYCTVNNR